MAVNLKQFIYTKGTDTVLDSEFANGTVYGKIKLAGDMLFWKTGLRWCMVPIAQVQRVFRRVERVYGKMCCGRASFDIHRLVLVLCDGTELELHIGDNGIGDQVKHQAEALYQHLQEVHPELQYGKK